MKFSKLALASVAALGLAGVAQADTELPAGYYVGESLEDWGTLGEGTLSTPQTGANVYGKEDSTAAVWFGAAADDTAILAYEDNAPSGSNKFPTINGSATTVGSKYLKVSNSSTLWRMLKSYSWTGDKPTEFPNGEGVAVDVADPDYGTEENPIDAIYNGGLFVDTLVQFTPSEDPPTVEEGSKLIVWMNTNGVLCVTAGKLSYAAGWTNPRTDFETGTHVDTNTWYRLTVSAFNDVCYAEGSGRVAHGFVVYIDGTPVVSTTATVDASALEQAAFAPLDPVTVTGNCYPEVLALINAKKFFCSLDCVTSKASLSAVGFKGEGLVDDIVVSVVDPFPVSPSPAGGIDFTLNWGNDVSAVWYSIDNGENKVQLTVVPAAAINLPSAAVGDTLIIGGTAADSWSFVAETTNTLAASGNSWTVTATAAQNAAAAGVANEAFADWTPAEVKAAFGDQVTPAALDAADAPELDYQFGQTLGKLSAAPSLEIIGIAQNAADSTKWDITVQVVAGENALSIDDGSKSTMRAALKVIAADTIAGLATTEPATYDLDFDETATDLTITVPAADGQFFKAAIVYTDAKPTVTPAQEP